MYRAKVEQISGTNIRADGKWLRCIGNKNVRVGDYVWTDGRCVYGYDQESMMPLVINNPEDLDSAIPLRCGDNFYIFTNKLKFVGTEENIQGVITNNKNSVWGITEKFIAGNCDNFNNVYTMVERAELDTYRRYSLVDIKMNGKVITTIDTSNFCNDCRKKALSLVPSAPAGYYATCETNIVWAFIENIDNWAIVVSSKAEAVSDRETWEQAENIAAQHAAGEPDSDPYEVFYNISQNLNGLNDHNANVDEAYYIDSKEKKIKLLSGIAEYELTLHDYRAGEFKSEIISTDFNEQISDFKFPMHDDFFFENGTLAAIGLYVSIFGI